MIKLLTATAVSLAVLAGTCAPASATERPRLIAYGHSYVAGYGVAESYPAIAASQLGDRIVNRAVSGAVLVDMLRVVRAEPRPSRRSTVVVQIGLNDARLHGLRGIRGYRAHLRRLFDRLATAHLVVVVLDPTIPGWAAYAPYDHGSPAVMRRFRAMTRTVARWHLPHRAVVRPRLSSLDWQTDRIHPNDVGAEEIATQVADAVRCRS